MTTWAVSLSDWSRLRIVKFDTHFCKEMSVLFNSLWSHSNDRFSDAPVTRTNYFFHHNRLLKSFKYLLLIFSNKKFTNYSMVVRQTMTFFVNFPNKYFRSMLAFRHKMGKKTALADSSPTL